jgi:hypothetical protein
MEKRLPSARAAVIAACVVASGCLGASSALAAPLPGENIFATGSSLQAVAQQKIWIPKWEGTPADQATITCSPSPCKNTYTSTGSGNGLAEFGNTTGTLDLTKDPTADNGATNGYGTPVLDGYAGSDDPPTGPLTTAGTNLNNASKAATGSAGTPIDEITIPVLQAPVAQLVSLPKGLTIGCSVQGGNCVNGNLKLKNLLWQELWSDQIPSSKDYAANTWGAFLEWAGLGKVASNPTATQFTDTGGGTNAITLNVRTNGSGTSYTFKGGLNLSGAPLYNSSFVTDSPTWPVTTNPAGTTGAAVAQTTESNPGSVGYANLADAALLTGVYKPYTGSAQTVTRGGTHQILFAQLQANWCGTGSPTCGDTTGGGAPQYVFAQPGSNGKANVYQGTDINVNGGSPNGVGHWNVPFKNGSFDPTGAWGGTLADDPDVYDHSLHNGVKTANYPVVAVTYELAWSQYDEAGSNVIGDYGGSAAQATDAGRTASSFLKYMVASGKGQSDLVAAQSYYTRLPSNIDGFAVAAANVVTP